MVRTYFLISAAERQFIDDVVNDMLYDAKKLKIKMQGKRYLDSIKETMAYCIFSSQNFPSNGWQWNSICSAHKEPNVYCNTCGAGYWNNLTEDVEDIKLSTLLENLTKLIPTRS